MSKYRISASGDHGSDGIEQEERHCGMRDKFAKPWKGNESYFQLYTTYSKPGLVSIFYNEDERSFHNWGLEVGSGPKRGRIREAIDHQINAPVLEIAGHHNGSVYMVCPPDRNSTINVEMSYVTMLMKDMHGYSSVEFTVSDTLGYSRKICAQNFKSRCTIGELNCEIPMRLSPTWNYACVNLDGTLRNAFGTRLVAVQRIKINANVRVRRIYFHEEVFPFRSLPQEFRIKLTLTPQEKQEIQMYEEFMYSEPNTNPERTIPWCMPRLMISQPSEIDNALRMSTAHLVHPLLRRRVEIMEVPLKEDNSDKYANVGTTETQAASNAQMLREMLQKSIPPSKILLPTLSLIYPGRKGHDEAEFIQTDKVNEYLHKKGKKEARFFGRDTHESCDGLQTTDENETEHLRKIKKCIEDISPMFDVQDESGDTNLDFHRKSDWEKFHHQHHSTRSSKVSQYEQPRASEHQQPRGSEYQQSQATENQNQQQSRVSELQQSRQSEFQQPRQSEFQQPRPSEYPQSRPSEYPQSRPSEYPQSRPSEYPQSRPSEYPQSRPSEYQPSQANDNPQSRASEYQQSRPSEAQEPRPSEQPSVHNIVENKTSAGESAGGSPRSEHHHHHHHHHGCGKFTVNDLAKYVKHRETFGDYDMFSSTVGNTKFLMVPGGEIIEESDSDSVTEDGTTIDGEREPENVALNSENPFHRGSTNSHSSHRKSDSRQQAMQVAPTPPSRRSTVSRVALQDPVKQFSGVDGIDSNMETIDSTESWLLTWAYDGVGWVSTREINQKLLNDARNYFASENRNRKSLMEAGMGMLQQNQAKHQRVTPKLPAMYRCAVPMLPRDMKEELRGTGGFYDIIVDNPTLPIEHY